MRLKEKHPNAIVAGISPNLASMESVRKAFKETSEKYGCVGILVNNAGISENTSFMDYAEETFDKVIDLNIKGVFNATRVATECMVARGKGVILSTSSMVSISGQPSGVVYPASKFAVNGLTVSLLSATALIESFFKKPVKSRSGRHRRLENNPRYFVQILHVNIDDIGDAI